MLKALLSIIVAATISGCTVKQPTESPDPARTTSLASVEFSDCVGFDTALEYSFDLGPGDAPPGWAFNPLESGRYGTYVAMMLMACNRFSGADLERGPVFFLIETHSKFTAPEGCEYGGLDRMAILSKILVSDGTVAEALMRAGLPAVAASIGVTFDNSTGFSQDWQWTVQGQGTSQLKIAGQGSPGAAAPVVERLISWNANELLVLDVTWRLTSAQPSSSIVFGELSPGMLVSGDSTQTYADLGDLNLEAEATGMLRTFGDFECREPL